MSRTALSSRATLAGTVVLALFIISSPVVGQSHSWIYVTSQASDPLGPPGPIVLREVALVPGGPGPITRDIRFAGRLGSAPVVSFDGRFVAWIMTPDGAAGPALAVFDRLTGGTTIFHGLGGDAIVADPSALRLFVLRASGGSGIDTIRIVEPGQVRDVAIAPISGLGPISPDGRDLFVWQQIVDPGGTTWRYRIAVLDPLTGAERRHLPPFEPFNRIVGIDVSRDGARLFVTMDRRPDNLRVLDGVTGTLLASTTIPLIDTLEAIGGVTFDERHDRLFVTRVRYSGSAGASTGAVILDSGSLAMLASSQAGQRIVDWVQRIVVGVGGFSSRFSGCGGVTVETWAAGPTPVSSLDVALDGGCPQLGLATAPEPPATMTVAVAGRRVTLDWTPVPGAVDYQVEAGSAPGLANLVVLRAGATAGYTADGVPSGTYYVRVRALNSVGASAPSVERVVTVP